MSSTYYDIVYPNKGRQLLDGGLNTKFERSIIPENETPDAQNVLFNQGSVGTRGGSAKLNTTAVGSFVCDGIYTRRDTSNAETMVAWFGGSLYTLGTTTFTTVASAQSVFTAGQRVAAAQYQNHMFFGDGGVTPYKYDGVYFTRHGVPMAANAPTLSSAATGILSAGIYAYEITYVNSFAVEGDVSSSATITLASSGQIGLASLPVAPQSFGVNARRIYRLSPGTLTYKFVHEIADNTTTTYQDNIATTALGEDAPDDQGEPPDYSVITYHQNRMFVDDASNRNFLWYSEIGEPYTFKATNFIQIADAASDLLYTIDVHQNNIIIGAERSTWMLYMPDTDPTGWSLLRITSSYGSKSPFGNFLYNDKFGFAATQNARFVGYGSITGSSINPSATALDGMIAGSELTSGDIETDMFNVQNAFVRNTSTMIFNNKAYIAVTYGTSTTNNRVYIFDFSISNLSRSQKFSWSRYLGINAAQMTVYNNRLYYGTSLAEGRVYQLETDVYDDSSTGIDSYFWTKEFSGLDGHENYVKDFRRLRILVDMAGAFKMNISWRVDSDSGETAPFMIDLEPDSSVWGTMIWGVDKWGAGAVQKEFEVPLGSTYGKRIQFKFTNQGAAGQRFRVHGLNFTYNLRGLI